MTDSLEQIVALPASRRYAEAIALAAGAEMKIAELTEALAESDYYRNSAEAQLNSATWPEGIGQVFHVGTDAPDETVEALLDLSDGAVFVRRNATLNNADWVRADAAGSSSIFTWPFGDLSGPFIKVQSGWTLKHLFDELHTANAVRLQLRDALSGRPSFTSGGRTPWTIVEIGDGVARVVSDQDAALSEKNSQINKLTRQLADANRALESRPAVPSEA